MQNLVRPNKVFPSGVVILSWGNVEMARFKMPSERCCVGKRKSFGSNHKIMIKVQESSPNNMVTRKSIVYESLGKRLVVQGEDASPLMHPT